MVEGKFKNLCRNIGIILCIGLIVFSLYKIVPYFMDEWKTKKFSDDVQRIAITNGKESPIDESLPHTRDFSRELGSFS